MPVTQYIGARYMPIFADPPEHSSAKTYEPLTIVLHEGNSYTSKQFVPKGIQITNETYWAETGNYNAQVEQYRQEVARLSDDVDDLLLQSATHIKRYATVAEMQADSTLELGAGCYVDGYYAARDGGACMFLVGATNAGLMPIQLDNGRYAVRTNTSSYNALALGFKRDNASDNAQFMYKILEYAQQESYPQLDIFFPAGCYRFSPVKLPIINLTLRGVGYETLSNCDLGSFSDKVPIAFNSGTVFSALSNQTHILWLGSDATSELVYGSTVFPNNTIRDIAFTSLKPNADESMTSKMYHLTNGALVLDNMYMSTFDNLAFMYIHGIGLIQMYGYENDFYRLKFRNITPFVHYDDGSMVLTRNTRQPNGDENISACTYDVLLFEHCYGSALQVLNVGIVDCNFGFISYEDGYRSGFNIEAVNFTETTSTVPIVYVKHDFEVLETATIEIDSLSLNYPSRFTFTSEDGHIYSHDVGVSVAESNSAASIVIDKITSGFPSNKFWYLDGAKTNYGPAIKFVVNAISRKIDQAGSNNTPNRNNKYVMRGYATYAYVNNGVYALETAMRKRFEGINANMIGTKFTQLSSSNAPRLMCNPIDMAPSAALASNFGLALNTPNVSSGTSLFDIAQFNIPSIRHTFLAYVIIPTDNTADAPIVDATTAGGALSELVPTYNKIATNLYEIEIDCSNVTVSHTVIVCNALANNTENVLIGYEWV